MARQIEAEVKVGLFVAIGVTLAMATTFILGGNSSFFTRKTEFTSHFNSVDGLIVGARVILGGVAVGTIEDIILDKEDRNIRIKFSIARDATEWIRKDATVEIATQGVLGDKYLTIHGGNHDQPPLEEGADIPHVATKDISQFLNKGDQLLVTLNSAITSLDRILRNFEADNRSDTFFRGLVTTAKNMSTASEKLNKEISDIQIKKTVGSLSQIFEKINNGTGTLGALINDPALYDEVRALVGGANRNRIIRNLVRQTIKNSKDADDHQDEKSETKQSR